MTVWALIPVKRFDEAKTRLSACLAPHQRQELAIAMLLDTLSAVTSTKEIDRAAIVSNDPLAFELAADMDVLCLSEPEQGLNSALEFGRTELLAKGAATILVLPADIPAIGSADIKKVIATGQEHASAVIVPDHEETGTNALLLHRGMEMPFSFGHDSCARHLESALTHTIPMQTLNLPAIANDCDFPEDIDRLQASEPGPHTQQAFQAIASPRLAKMRLAP